MTSNKYSSSLSVALYGVKFFVLLSFVICPTSGYPPTFLNSLLVYPSLTHTSKSEFVKTQPWVPSLLHLFIYTKSTPHMFSLSIHVLTTHECASLDHMLVSNLTSPLGNRLQVGVYKSTHGGRIWCVRYFLEIKPFVGKEEERTLL